MKREDIQEYLDCNGFEALTSFDGTKYYNEEKVISIALEVVKSCSIQSVSVSSFVDSIADNTTYINGKHYSNEFKKLTVPVIEYNILKKLAKDYDNSNSR